MKDARHIDPVFKGWRKPGPLPDVAQMEALELGPEETLDALSGHWRIVQLQKGHRFSTDDILTAWYGSSWAPSVGRALDLGSGLGTVAMVVMWRLPGASVVSIEAQEVSVGLAKKARRYNGLEGRWEIRTGDFREDTCFEQDEVFDLVTGTPPYFPPEAGVLSEHPQKVACRFEMRGDIASYCQRARAQLAPAGVFACVFPIKEPMQHERVRAAAKGAGLVIVRWRPVALRQGDEPLLGLFLMQRKEDLPEKLHGEGWEEPVLTIRQRDGHVNPEYAAVKLSMGFPP